MCPTEFGMYCSHLTSLNAELVEAGAVRDPNQAEQKVDLVCGSDDCLHLLAPQGVRWDVVVFNGCRGSDIQGHYNVC